MTSHAAPRRAACRSVLHVLVPLLGLQACSPTYDWRETLPPDAAVMALFPCKPDRFSRPVVLAGAPVQMLLVSCATGGTTFALTHVELADAASVGPALQSLREAAIGNVGGAATVVAPMKVPGMMPNALAERLQIEGRRPDGSVLRVQAGFFTAGMRVYQATAVGSTLDAEALDTFFSGLRLRS